MTTASARLVLLSGLPGLSAGLQLASLAAGANAGARMVARSGLASATAGVHLMHDTGPEPTVDGRLVTRSMIIAIGRIM